MPVYLNALSGDGVHVVVKRRYLASTAREMGELYNFLGCRVKQQECLQKEACAAYTADMQTVY